MKLLILKKKKKEEKKKRFWVNPVWMHRKSEGEFHTAMQVMKSDPAMFFKYYRMTPQKFSDLHSIVKDSLRKYFLCREPVCSEERLAITLRYLSSGMSIKDVAMLFRIGHETCRSIIHQTCRAIWKHLQPLYMPVPGCKQWEEIAHGFGTRWNFPNCLGAVDGKHVAVMAPPNSGSNYFNYKGTFSIVLMAVVDPQYKFSMVSVGAPGRHSDGGVFKSCEFGRQLEKGTLPLPNLSRLPNSNKVVPHVFVGDEAFQLRHDFLRPFPGKNMSPSHRVFNYRLSRARRIVENAFGILAARWRILLNRINLLPKNAEFVVLACCVLHNFLCAGKEYMPHGFVDSEDEYGNITPGQWRDSAQSNDLLDLEPTAAKNYSKSAAEVRNLFVQHFMSEGAVPWQWAHSGVQAPT